MKKTTLRVWPMYSLLAVFFLMGVTLTVYAHFYAPPAAVVSSNQAAQIPKAVKDMTVDDPWPLIYPDTVPMTIKDISLQASVAKSWPERIKGLSDTPYLPMEVAKFFVFDTEGFHSIWMKDMKYAIDIIWVDASGKIVHIKENATPESYPEMFVPNKLATYVIETAQGFVEQNDINVGDTVTLPIF